MKKAGFYWHAWHNQLISWLSDYNRRAEEIKTRKPLSEIPLRFRLMKEVRGKLPDDLVQAEAAYEQAWAAYEQAYEQVWPPYGQARAAFDQTRAAYIQAGAILDQTIASHRPEIKALHALECPDCPWDGRTIFPEKEE